MTFAIRGTLIVLAMIAIGLVTWKISSMGNPAHELPAVTGPYGTGVAVYHLIDHERMDPHVANSKQPREVSVHIWYPVHKGITGNRAPYAGNAQVAKIIEGDVRAHFCHTPQDLSFLHKLKTSSLIDAPIAPDKPAYPVLIFSPGAGAPITIYTNFLQELASHGYIVMGVDYPYVSNPTMISGDRVVSSSPEALHKTWGTESNDVVWEHEQRLWVADISFIVKELAKLNERDPKGLLSSKLALDKIGLFGHSFGGGVSIAASKIQGVRATVNIDGRVSYDTDAHASLWVPTLFLRSPYHAAGKNEKIKAFIATTAQGLGQYREVSGMLHGTFSDLFLLLPWNQPTPGPIDVAKGVQETRRLLVEFFDQHVKTVHQPTNTI